MRRPHLSVRPALDPSPVGAVGDVRVRWLRRSIRIAPTSAPGAGTIRLELWGAHRKSQPLADLAGVPVEIVAPDRSVLSSDDVSADDE